MSNLTQKSVGLLKFAIGIAIIAWLVSSNRDAISAINSDALRPEWLFPGLAIMFVAIAVSFVRWWTLVNGAGLSLRLTDAMVMGYVGYAFNLLLPGAVGGDLVKSVMIARRQSRRVTAVTTVVMDRIVGLMGLVIMTSLIGGCWVLFGNPDSEIKSIALATCLLSPLVIVALIVMFSRTIIESRPVIALCNNSKLGGIVSGAVDAVRAYRSNPVAILIAIGLTLVGQSLLVLGIWVVGAALYPNTAPLTSHFLLMPLGLSAGAIPLTPGGLGVLDVAVVELYRMAGHETATAVAMMLGYRLAQVLMSVFGFVLYFAFARKLIDHSKADAANAGTV